MSLDKKVFILRERSHLDYFLRWIAEHWERQSMEGKPIAITASETKRSLDQNAAQWPILQAWSEQVEWQINGKAQFLTSDDWKSILTAAFMHETGRIAPGIEGGMVLLGARTREFTVRQFSEWLEFLHTASATRGIDLSYSQEKASCNMQNLHRAHKDSASHLLGVVPNHAQFAAQIRMDGKNVHIGNFATPEEAHEAYLRVKRTKHLGCAI